MILSLYVESTLLTIYVHGCLGVVIYFERRRDDLTVLCLVSGSGKCITAFVLIVSPACFFSQNKAHKLLVVPSTVLK